MSPSPHLSPMAPGSLSPRPAPQAAAPAPRAALVPADPAPRENLLAPAVFYEKEPDPTDLFLLDDDDDDELLPDAVPSETMPYPACVPLFELAPLTGRRRKKG